MEVLIVILSTLLQYFVTSMSTLACNEQAHRQAVFVHIELGQRSENMVKIGGPESSKNSTIKKHHGCL